MTDVRNWWWWGRFCLIMVLYPMQDWIPYCQIFYEYKSSGRGIFMGVSEFNPPWMTYCCKCLQLSENATKFNAYPPQLFSGNAHGKGRPSPLRQWCISPLFQISPISELFPCFNSFSPYFGKFPPYFTFPPWFRKIYVFLHTLRVFRFPLLFPWCIYASRITQCTYWTPRPWEGSIVTITFSEIR